MAREKEQTRAKRQGNKKSASRSPPQTVPFPLRTMVNPLVQHTDGRKSKFPKKLPWMPKSLSSNYVYYPYYFYNPLAATTTQGSRLQSGKTGTTTTRGRSLLSSSSSSSSDATTQPKAKGRRATKHENPKTSRNDRHASRKKDKDRRASRRPTVRGKSPARGDRSGKKHRRASTTVVSDSTSSSSSDLSDVTSTETTTSASSIQDPKARKTAKGGKSKSGKKISKLTRGGSGVFTGDKRDSLMPIFKARKKGCCFGCNACWCGACDSPGGCCSLFNCGGCCDRDLMPPTGCCSRQKSFHSDDYREALQHRKRAGCCCSVD